MEVIGDEKDSLSWSNLGQGSLTPLSDQVLTSNSILHPFSPNLARILLG